MSQEEGNRVAQLSLARLVVEKVIGQPFDLTNVKIGPLSTNYFSFIFRLSVVSSQGTENVFVKIPKEDLRSGSRTILPISCADRRMAEDEASSLRRLFDQWLSKDVGVSWVRLRGEVSDYNAIVTDAVDGDEALTVFRRLDLRRRFGYVKDRDRLRAAMARLGAALGRFHRVNSKETVFQVDQAIPKLERYCRGIESRAHSPVLAEISQAIGLFAGLELDAVEVPTLKGIDIRNVLMNDQDGLSLLDPGRMKPACREADLARFIMTYRILYWGSGLFFLGLRPDTKAEGAFLEAYYSNSAPPSPKLLSFFIIKEQLKHWRTALDSLRLLPWPVLVKRIAATTYVNPYYTRQLTEELGGLI